MWQVLAIIAVNVVMYYRTLKYGYVIDDVNMVQTKSSGKKWTDLWWEIRGHHYFNSIREHGITVAVHTLNCVLLYLAFHQSNVAFLAAILFSINPSNNQCTVWLSGKGYLYTTTLILLGIWLLPFFPFFYLLTFWWAGSAVLAPLLFLFHSPFPYILCLPICMYIFRKRTAVVLRERAKEATTLMKKLSWGKVVVAIKCYIYYFFLSLFPHKLGMYHTFCYTLGLDKKGTEKWESRSPLFYFGCILIVEIILNIIFNWGEMMWGIVWFSLFIMQWCNLTTLYQPIAERYLYLANVGMMYALSCLIYSHPILITIFITTYIIRLYYYLPTYTDHLTFFKSNVDNFPDLYNVYNSYGGELYGRGKIGAAIDVWIDGLQCKPDDFKLNSNLATALVKIGNLGMALKYFENARKGINLETDEVKLIPDYDKKIEQLKQMVSGTISIPTPLT